MGKQLRHWQIADTLYCIYSSCCCTQCIWISPDITALYKRALGRQNHYLSRLCASILLFWLEEHTTAIFSFALIFLLTYTETSQHTEYVHIQSLYDSRGQQFFQGLLKTLPEVVGELRGQVSRPNSRYSPISGTRRPCSIPRRGSRSVSASFGESVYTTLHLPSCVYVASLWFLLIIRNGARDPTTTWLTLASKVRACESALFSPSFALSSPSFSRPVTPGRHLSEELERLFESRERPSGGHGLHWVWWNAGGCVSPHGSRANDAEADERCDETKCGLQLQHHHLPRSERHSN